MAGYHCIWMCWIICLHIVACILKWMHDVQSPKKMGNRGTRFLRKVCEREEGLKEIKKKVFISTQSNSFG